MPYDVPKTPAELEVVIAAIDKADPEEKDSELTAQRDALRWARGWGEETAFDYIGVYVSDE